MQRELEQASQDLQSVPSYRERYKGIIETGARTEESDWRWCLDCEDFVEEGHDCHSQEAVA